MSTCAAGYAAGVVLGSLNNGYSASRENYGVFSFNLNALFNPSSVGGYTWSRFCPPGRSCTGRRRLQLSGLWHAGIAMRAVRGGSGVGCAQQGRPRRAGGLLRRNLVLILGMTFGRCSPLPMSSAFDDVELLNIPLPEGLVKLCGIFRASGRIFYPVYYVLMTACIVGLARLLRRGEQKLRCIRRCWCWWRLCHSCLT